MASEADTTIGDLERRMGVTGKSAETCPEHGGYIAIHRDGHPPSGCPVCARVEREREEEEHRAGDEAGDPHTQRHPTEPLVPGRHLGRAGHDERHQRERQRPTQLDALGGGPGRRGAG